MDPFSVESPWYVGTRLVAYAALLAVIGSTVSLRGLMPWLRTRARLDTAEQRRAFRLLRRRLYDVQRYSSLAWFVAWMARWAMQSLAFFGPPAAWDFDGAWTLTWDTAWGRAWLLQGVSVAMLMALPNMTRRPGTRDQLLASGALLALVVGQALGGHAVTVAPPAVGVVAHVLHLMAAGHWLGLLAVLCMGGLLRAPLTVQSSALSAFSRVAQLAVGVLLLSGVAMAWLHGVRPQSVWGPSYARLVLLKVLLVMPTLALGGWNWRVVLPRLANGQSVPAFRISAWLEIGIGIGILIVTATLVATELPG